MADFLGQICAAPSFTPYSKAFSEPLGVFVNSTDLANSVLYQSGSQIGLNTTTPFDLLHVRFGDVNGQYTGYAVQNLASAPNAYSGMLFYDQNGALGQFQGFN